MHQYFKFLSPRNAFLISVLFYLVLLIILFPFYCYQLDPDGISYIGIAQKYLIGDFENAINGCWGPLMSWLLIPFLAAGFKPLVGFKILTGTIGLLSLFQFNKLLTNLDIDTNLYLPSLLCATIVILNFALTLVAPDLMFAFFGICLVNVLLKYSASQENFLTTIAIGIIGALLFFTKNYGLPFFFVTFSLINLVIFFRNDEKTLRWKLIQRYLVGIFVFGMVSFIWIYLISAKYGYWTIGTAGHYNHIVFGPQSLGHPMFYIGLMEPSNITATTVMEDFSYVELPAWNASDWTSHVQFYISRFLNNFFAYFKILNDFSFTTACLLIISIIYLIQLGRKAIYNKILVLLLFLFVLTSGYLILLIEHRYLWLYNLLMIVIGSYFLTQFFKTFKLSSIASIMLIGAFYCSFLLYPGITLSRNFNKGFDLYSQHQQIQHLNLKGRIATKGTWYGGAVLAYYSGCQYYGVCKHIAPESVAKELAEHEIDYLVVWRNAYSELDDAYFENVTNGVVEDFEVYKIR